jgi:hypothetical protein
VVLAGKISCNTGWWTNDPANYFLACLKIKNCWYSKGKLNHFKARKGFTHKMMGSSVAFQIDTKCSAHWIGFHFFVLQLLIV